MNTSYINYLFTRCKRFIVFNLLSYSILFLVIQNSNFKLISHIPLYLPPAISFTLTYFFGFRGLFGLFIGSLGYLIKDLSITNYLLLVTGDIILMSIFGNKAALIFSQDQNFFQSINELGKFVMIVFIASLLSASMLYLSSLSSNFIKTSLSIYNSICLTVIFLQLLIHYPNYMYSKLKINYILLSLIILSLFTNLLLVNHSLNKYMIFLNCIISIYYIFKYKFLSAWMLQYINCNLWMKSTINNIHWLTLFSDIHAYVMAIYLTAIIMLCHFNSSKEHA